MVAATATVTVMATVTRTTMARTATIARMTTAATVKAVRAVFLLDRKQSTINEKWQRKNW